jgi:hypothetical protein
MKISNSTLSGNTANYVGRDGGAIYNGGSMKISNSTLSGNSATGGYGGAIYEDFGSLTLSNSTLTDNSAQLGSAIDMGPAYPYGGPNVTVTGCTQTDSNTSDSYLVWVDGGTLTVKNSYFHNAHGYIFGPYKDGGGNTFN